VTRFELSKWYLDVVTEDGRLAILYLVRLRLGAVAIHAQGLLQTGPGGQGVRTRWSALPARAPRHSGTGFRVACLGLGARVHSQSLAPAFEATLWSGPDGSVTWRCLAPRAETELVVAGETWRGLGYVEQLQMTVPPWRLPIRQLRWGRLLSPRGGIVWIDWRGPVPLRLALSDGIPVSASVVGDRGLRIGRTPHRLRRVATLRDAPLGRTLPGLVRRCLPRNGLALRETKWLSRGQVGGAPGFAIHEVVTWP